MKTLSIKAEKCQHIPSIVKRKCQNRSMEMHKTRCENYVPWQQYLCTITHTAHIHRHTDAH